jgi:parallel beta-helix repeat protein
MEAAYGTIISMLQELRLIAVAGLLMGCTILSGADSLSLHKTECKPTSHNVAPVQVFREGVMSREQMLDDGGTGSVSEPFQGQNGNALKVKEENAENRSQSLPSSVPAVQSLFVAPTGSDSNDGRSGATPFKTIACAARAAAPGDVVTIRGGTYQEYVVVETSGTAERPITFEAYPEEQVVVDGSGRTPNPTISPGADGNPPLLTVSGNYVTVKGLEVKNAAGDGVAVYGNHVILDTLHVHHNFMSGINVWKAVDGLIQNCQVHDNWDYRPDNPHLSGDNADGIHLIGPSSRMTVRNNTVYHNSDDGIDNWDSTNNVIEGNTIYNNGYDTGGDGQGVKLSSGGGNVVRGNLAHHNRLAGFDGGQTGGTQIRNNTAYANGVDFTNSSSDDLPAPNIFADNVGVTTYQMGAAIQLNNSWNRRCQSDKRRPANAGITGDIFLGQLTP